MTQDEFEVFRARSARNFATEQVRAGNWEAGDAQKRVGEQMAELLPQDLETPGMLFFTAETASGDSIGYLWLALERDPDSGGGAWIYDIEVLEERRGEGYGLALLSAAEKEAGRRGVKNIGLNVFGSNVVARSLYERAGYQITSMYMRKELGPTI
jgi:ribosomal protein S18 acetylase RimI-like enzyme